MTLAQKKVDEAVMVIESMRDRLLEDARMLERRAEEMVPLPGTVFVVAKMQQSARDTRLLANSLPCFGLRPE